MKGDDVKWLQWELVEAGYPIALTGTFDIVCKGAVLDFQKSCKIGVDGEVGSQTIGALIGNTGK